MKINLKYTTTFRIEPGTPMMEALPIIDVKCDCGRVIRYALQNGCEYDRDEAETIQKSMEECDEWWFKTAGFRPFQLFVAEKLQKMMVALSIDQLEQIANSSAISAQQAKGERW